MDFQNFYSKNITGMIDYAANTLGLNGACTTFTDPYTGCSSPGTSGNSGAWITTNTASFATANWQSFVNGLPVIPTNGGTTFDYTQASSYDLISIPPDTEVDYALLVWSGIVTEPTIDVSTRPITFTPPGSLPLSITPTFSTISTSGDYFYTACAEVTSIVSATGNGLYTVGNVYSEFITNTACAGWVLYVVYKHSSLTFRNISISVGGLDVTTTAEESTTLTGFRTSDAPYTFSSMLIVSALNGNPASLGDQISLTNAFNVPSYLFGPYNPVTNFFGSQIINVEGTYCSDGTFGSLNATPNTIQTNPGRRSGFDITIVDTTVALSNNQSSSTFTATTTGDGYYVLSLASIIENAEPIINVVASSSKSGVFIGDSYTVTYTITNNGTLGTNSLDFTYASPTGLTFVSGYYTKNSINYPILATPNGLALPNLSPTESIVVNLTYEANVVPTILHYPNIGETHYTFTIGPDIVENTIEASVPVITGYIEILETTDLNPVSTLAPMVDPADPGLNYIITSPPQYGTVTIVNGLVTYTPSIPLPQPDKFVITVTHDGNDYYVPLTYIVTSNTSASCPNYIPYQLVHLLNNDIFLMGITDAGLTVNVCFNCDLWLNGYTHMGELIIRPIRSAFIDIIDQFIAQLEGILASTSSTECGSPAFKSQVDRLLVALKDLKNKIMNFECIVSCDINLYDHLLELLSQTIDLLISLSSLVNGFLELCKNNCPCVNSFSLLMGQFINLTTLLYSTLPDWNNLVITSVASNSYSSKPYVPGYVPNQPLNIPQNNYYPNRFTCPPPRNC